MREMELLIDQFRAQIISKDRDPNEKSTTIKGNETCDTVCVCVCMFVFVGSCLAT